MMVRHCHRLICTMVRVGAVEGLGVVGLALAHAPGHAHDVAILSSLEAGSLDGVSIVTVSLIAIQTLMISKSVPCTMYSRIPASWFPAIYFNVYQVQPVSRISSDVSQLARRAVESSLNLARAPVLHAR